MSGEWEVISGAPSSVSADSAAAEASSAVPVETAKGKGKSKTPPPNHSPASEADLASPFPPTASTSGKKYYCFFRRQRPGKLHPAVVCGWKLALRELGGDWSTGGRAPKGFASLEDAIAYLDQWDGPLDHVPIILR